MNENVPQSGDFLEDVEITIILRSGKSELRSLKRIQQVMLTSVVNLLDTEVLLLLHENKVTQTPNKELHSMKTVLFIK